MKKVLITGGAGFIGSHVADRFLLNNYEVIAADNLVTGNIDNINGKNIKFFNIDIRDKEKLEEVFNSEKPDYVIHLAAQVSVSSSVEDVLYDAEENITALINILELLLVFLL